MWESHDDNWKSKASKGKDNDIDININVSVDKDGEPCFDKIDSTVGAASASINLNLCDVARGLRDVQSTLNDASHGGGGRTGHGGGDWGGPGAGGRDERQGYPEGHEHHKRGAAGRLGDAIDFNPLGSRNEEPPFIDCKLGRLLEANKVDMLQKYARIGAVLKGTHG